MWTSMNSSCTVHAKLLTNWSFQAHVILLCIWYRYVHLKVLPDTYIWIWWRPLNFRRVVTLPTANRSVLYNFIHRIITTDYLLHVFRHTISQYSFCCLYDVYMYSFELLCKIIWCLHREVYFRMNFTLLSLNVLVTRIHSVSLLLLSQSDPNTSIWLRIRFNFDLDSVRLSSNSRRLDFDDSVIP